MSNMRIFGPTLIAAVTAMSVASAPAQEAAQEYTYPPLSYSRGQYYLQHPDEFQQLLESLPRVSHVVPLGKVLAPGEAPGPNTWTTGAHNPGVDLSNPLLMTDGTVIAHVSCSGTWYKLTPDITGSYINGTWAKIASLPSGYTPRFFGSGVLPDGRVIIEGGEYNSKCRADWTNLGAIYDPVTNSWKSVTPPSGWTEIGDAAGDVLDNGTYLQTSCCAAPATAAALLNASTLTWTPTGKGKFDLYDEEGVTKLPTGKLLDVDAYVGTGTCGKNSELYNPSTGDWSTAGNTVNQESDCTGYKSYELGPLVMRPNGTTVIFPGVTTGKAITNIYTVSTGKWAAGPTLPATCGSNQKTQCTLADAPAAVLPNGSILFAASGFWTAKEQFPRPTNFFLMAPNGTITAAPSTADAADINSYEANLLVLPNGQILEVSTDTPNVQYYTPSGTYESSWQPVIKSAPTCVVPGSTYLASGTQFNGLTEAGFYGDDVNAATNFPLVQIVNGKTKNVFYARTFNHSSRSIAPNASVSTNFQVASATETGASTLYVIANGIPSKGKAITVAKTCTDVASE